MPRQRCKRGNRTQKKPARNEWAAMVGSDHDLHWPPYLVRREKGALRVNPGPFALALVAALIALLIALLTLTPRAESERAEPCVENELAREHIRSIILMALDRALRNHTVQTFDVWMKDVAQQPKRAQAGMRMAISAHVRSRADALKWNPPMC